MYKKFGLWLVYGLLLLLIIAPNTAQQIQTIRLPELQPITAENITDIQLLGTFENFRDIGGTFVTNFTLSPNHRWLALNLFGAILVYDLTASNFRFLGESTDLGIGGFSNDSQFYLMPQNTGTNIFDVATWRVIGTLPDGFVIVTAHFSPDDSRVAVFHEIIRGYLGDKSDGIYLFETENWTQVNKLPVDERYLSHYFEIGFLNHNERDVLLTQHPRGTHVFAWDYINITNYADPMRPLKSDLINSLERQTYPASDSARYQWVGFINPDGDYALWLTMPNGDTIFAKSDGTYEDVTIGETGEDHDGNGIPQIYGAFTRLARQQNVALLQASDSGEVSFGTPTGNVVIISRTETSQALPLFTYDTQTDVLWNNRRDFAYTTEEIGTNGAFISIDADSLLPIQFLYRLDGYPIPDTITQNENNTTTNLYFTGQFSADGRYILATTRDIATNTTHLLGYDLVNDVHMAILEGFPVLDVGYPFSFNILQESTIALITFVDRDAGLFSQLQAWDIASGTLVHTIPTDTFATKTVLSPDNRLLVIGGGQVRDRIEFWGIPQP